jgi:MFS family permease
MAQVRNDLLSRISRIRVSAEFGAAEVSRWKMVEVGCTRFTWSPSSKVGHVSSLNIFIWGVALCGHAACKNFVGLFVVRLILGICEGSTTAGFMIVSSMFYTREEHTARVGYWCKD